MDKNIEKELNRLEKARTHIRNIMSEKGREYLYDLTGIAGGFEVSNADLELLETYVGPAIFSEKLNEVGVLHFGGSPTIHKAVGFNRTSAAIFSTIMALSDTVENVIHYVPKKPSHPSIPRSCNIFNLNYFESDEVNEILNKIDEKTLTIIKRK